ncbi:MAG: hypothetical protein FJ279_23695 [Planctomycetes bacterium]|nr:hypothetical protein [Planctomycetota bacterium]
MSRTKSGQRQEVILAIVATLLAGVGGAMYWGSWLVGLSCAVVVGVANATAVIFTDRLRLAANLANMALAGIGLALTTYHSVQDAIFPVDQA